MSRGRIHSLFFKLFASIMAITIAILIVQVVVVVVMLHQQSKEFENDVFDSYKLRLSELLDMGRDSEHVWTLQNIGPTLRMAVDDRISGLILRDAQGNTVLSLGRTPGGIVFGDTPKLPGESGITTLPEKYWYVGPSITGVQEGGAAEAPSRGVVMPDYPAPVREQDVVGTIELYQGSNQSELFGTVDVLVFGPMNYMLTAMLLRRMLSAFVITIPIALIIAFLGSHIIARTVSRHAARIAKSLGAVANNRFQESSYHTTMSELVQISESVEVLKHKLMSHERMRQQWLRGIAHDLNTPVTALKLSIESALDRVVPFDDKLLERMSKEHDELERRVGAVMTLASMESPDFQVNRTTMDVLDFVDEVVSSSLAGRKIVLDVQLEQIVGDRRLLVLVARELINNACKYGMEGTSVGWEIFQDDASADIIMRFRNKGILASAVMDHMFEPWFRADESRSQSGSGMGLAIVRQVMEAHEGEVSIHQIDDSVVVVVSWPQAQVSG